MHVAVEFPPISRMLKQSEGTYEREGYKVTVPPSVDVKSIRKGLNMTQAVFSDSFDFSLDTVKHWRGDGGYPRCQPGPISLSSRATCRQSWKRCTRPELRAGASEAPRPTNPQPRPATF